jgi:hypothetical protein
MKSIEFLFERLWDEPKDKLIWHTVLNKAKDMYNKEISDDKIDEYYQNQYGDNAPDKEESQVFDTENLTVPIDERDEAFQALRELIINAPLDVTYRIKLFDALSAYIQTLKY